MLKNLEPIRLPPSADRPVCMLREAFKVRQFSSLPRLYFPLDLLGCPVKMSIVPHSSREYGELIYPFYGPLISSISLLNFWLVCHLPQLGLQTQVSKAMGIPQSLLSGVILLLIMLPGMGFGLLSKSGQPPPAVKLLVLMSRTALVRLLCWPSFWRGFGGGTAPCKRAVDSL